MNIFESFIVKKYIAHRGFFNDEIPENSVAAFENAINNNYAIELDVRVSKDGVPFVFHDQALKRTTDADGYIEHLTEKEIKQIKLKNHESIPSLKEVLAFVNGRTPLLVDVKNEGKVGNTEKAVWQVLKTYKGEFAVCSYNPFTLEWFKLTAPEVLRGQYSSFFKKQHIIFAKKGWLKKFKYNHKSEPHFLVYNGDNLPNCFVKKYKQLPLLAYTIRSQKQYLHIVKHCDNIIFEGFEPEI